MIIMMQSETHIKKKVDGINHTMFIYVYMYICIYM